MQLQTDPHRREDLPTPPRPAWAFTIQVAYSTSMHSDRIVTPVAGLSGVTDVPQCRRKPRARTGLGDGIAGKASRFAETTAKCDRKAA